MENSRSFIFSRNTYYFTNPIICFLSYIITIFNRILIQEKHSVSMLWMWQPLSLLTNPATSFHIGLAGWLHFMLFLDENNCIILTQQSMLKNE